MEDKKDAQMCTHVLEVEMTLLLRPRQATLKWPNFKMEYGDSGGRVQICILMFCTNLLSLAACLYRKKPKSCSLLYVFSGSGMLAHITLLNIGRSFYA
jgi:hypothetical protein